MGESIDMHDPTQSLTGSVDPVRFSPIWDRISNWLRKVLDPIYYLGGLRQVLGFNLYPSQEDFARSHGNT